ncbi:MAG: ABC transporter permease [Vicinamibacterales bacterium]
MTTPAAPPAFAERLLRASVVDAEWRESITGDLREEYAAVTAARGAAAARRWYWRQALPLAARFLAGRVIPSATPARRRVSVADLERTERAGTAWTQELRHGWRALTQRPALSITIAATLALALASNAVVFNLADALYLRPFRFPDVDRLVLVVADTVGDKPYINRESVAPADFRDFSQQATSVTQMVAAEWWDPNLSGIDLPEQIPGFKVGPGYFELLGAQPLIGRTFTADEARPEANRHVVLSHKFWVRQFASDPGVLGRTIRLDGEAHEIVGVMPPRFAIPFGADVWAPLAYDDATWARRERGYLMVTGRLAEGHTVATADGEFRQLAARLAAELPRRPTAIGRPRS